MTAKWPYCPSVSSFLCRYCRCKTWVEPTIELEKKQWFHYAMPNCNVILRRQNPQSIDDKLRQSVNRALNFAVLSTSGKDIPATTSRTKERRLSHRVFPKRPSIELTTSRMRAKFRSAEVPQIVSGISLTLSARAHLQHCTITHAAAAMASARCGSSFRGW